MQPWRVCFRASYEIIGLVRLPARENWCFQTSLIGAASLRLVFINSEAVGSETYKDQLIKLKQVLAGSKV
jgi:hypothetical protein